MSGALGIHFTQDQARALTGVSVETLRHWRKTIPYLSTKTGKAARFAFMDVVGLAITHELVRSFGVNIAGMTVGLDVLFRLFGNIGPAPLHHTIVVITPTEAKIYDSDGGGLRPLLSAAAFVVPLAPLIARLQRGVLPNVALSDQVALPFPPEVVRSRA